MPENAVRTFVAVDIPKSVRTALGELVEPQRRRRQSAGTDTRGRAGIRWTRPEGWHITLAFLGELPPKDVERAIVATKAVASSAKPFSAAIDGWGVFPDEHRPRVLWAGVVSGAEEITAVATALDAQLSRDGFTTESRTFHPHVTIARIEDPRAGAQVFDALNSPRAQAGRRVSLEPFRVDRLTVFRSVLKRTGAEYSVLAECPFGQG